MLKVKSRSATMALTAFTGPGVKTLIFRSQLLWYLENKQQTIKCKFNMIWNISKSCKTLNTMLSRKERNMKSPVIHGSLLIFYEPPRLDHLAVLLDLDDITFNHVQVFWLWWFIGKSWLEKHEDKLGNYESIKVLRMWWYMILYIYIYIPRAHMTSILEVQPSKPTPFPITTRVRGVLGILNIYMK